MSGWWYGFLLGNLKMPFGEKCSSLPGEEYNGNYSEEDVE